MCAAEVDQVLACRDRCQEQVANLNELTAGSLSAYRGSAASSYRTLILYLGFAVLFLAYATGKLDVSKFVAPLGVIFLLAAVFAYLNTRQLAG